MLAMTPQRRQQFAKSAKVALIVVGVLLLVIVVLSLVIRAIALDADGTRVRHRFFVVGFFRRFGYR